MVDVKTAYLAVKCCHLIRYIIFGYILRQLRNLVSPRLMEMSQFQVHVLSLKFSLEKERFYFREINTLILKGGIKLIKRDSKEINTVLLNFLFIKTFLNFSTKILRRQNEVYIFFFLLDFWSNKCSLDEHTKLFLIVLNCGFFYSGYIICNDS